MSIRTSYLFCAIYSVVAIAFLMYLHISVLGSIPCPLCLFQFFCIVISGVFFIIVSLTFPSELIHAISSLIIVLANLFGIVLSVRHLTLQHSKEVIATCFQSKQQLLTALHWDNLANTFRSAFHSGVCHKQRMFLNIEVDYWMLGIFIIGFVLILTQLRRIKRNGFYA